MKRLGQHASRFDVHAFDMDAKYVAQWQRKANQSRNRHRARSFTATRAGVSDRDAVITVAAGGVQAMKHLGSEAYTGHGKQQEGTEQVRLLNLCMPSAQLPKAQCPMPNTQCPTPNAQCPMPNAQCPMPSIMPYAQCHPQCTIHNAECTMHNNAQRPKCQTPNAKCQVPNAQSTMPNAGAAA